jgi:serine-type D-Ala-D-Ala carboxypeptidase/endopeptidase
MMALVRFTMLAGVALAAVLAAPTDEEIRKILVERIDVRKQSVGIVVGMLEPGGRRVVPYGKLAAGDARTLDGDTVFEIGSITKVFTNLLLADMVQRGEVGLDDPVSKYLPPEVKMPRRGEREITLVDLATHTSGLPRLWSPFSPKDSTNPYADFTVDDMYRFLSGHELRRDPGAQYEYSNLGGGLLGHVLSRRAGMDYESLVRARITGPLGMNDTRIVLTPEMRGRLAVGHNAALKPVPNWDLPTLAGAGALRSTVNDLLKFAAMAAGDTSTPLAKAMALSLSVRRPTGPAAGAGEVALGWHINKVNQRELVWHNGGTGGYRSILVVDPVTHTGVVVLSNTSTGAGVDDIGRHLLEPLSPLLPAPRAEITVAPEVLERYVGRYELPSGLVIAITREGSQLYGQATNQPKLALFAEKENAFFLKDFDAQFTFETDAAGRTTGLVLHQAGRQTPGKRID